MFVHSSGPVARRLSRQTADRRASRAALPSAVLLLAMALLLAYSGWIVAGWRGVAWGVVAGACVFAGVRRAPTEVFLAGMRAEALTAAQAPSLHAELAMLCRDAGLSPPPRLYHIDENLPLAFSLGHGQTSAIVIADCLLTGLSSRELSGIVAHELAHLRNGDLTLKTLGFVLGWLTQIMSQLGFLLVLFGLLARVFAPGKFPIATLAILWLAPVAVRFLQLWLSRARETEADLEAAELTGDPIGLALALEKLQRWEEWRLRFFFPGRHMFRLPALFYDHPPTAARVARLYRMAGQT